MKRDWIKIVLYLVSVGSIVFSLMQLTERRQQSKITKQLQKEVDSLNSILRLQEEFANRKYLEAQKLLDEAQKKVQNESGKENK